MSDVDGQGETDKMVAQGGGGMKNGRKGEWKVIVELMCVGEGGGGIKGIRVRELLSNKGKKGGKRERE